MRWLNTFLGRKRYMIKYSYPMSNTRGKGEFIVYAKPIDINAIANDMIKAFPKLYKMRLDSINEF